MLRAEGRREKIIVLSGTTISGLRNVSLIKISSDGVGVPGITGDEYLRNISLIGINTGGGCLSSGDSNRLSGLTNVSRIETAIEYKHH